MNKFLAAELVMPTDHRRGFRIQEWLCHHGLNVSIDGVVGPATKAAIREFQVRRSVHDENGVGPKTWEALVEPIRLVTKEVALLPGDSLQRLVLVVAGQHLHARPREIGGQNRGPWVRLYMQGNDGSQWPWCAGFTSFILQQACALVGAKMPLPYAFGCDSIADAAREAGIFHDGGIRPSPGWLFLVPGKPNHWQHIGIVVGTDGAATMKTIEGNTNSDGSSEGFEVCSRTRAVSGGKGFIRIG